MRICTLLNITMGTPYYNPHVNRPYARGGYEQPENPVDGVAQGQFVWRIADTPTIPFKFGNLKVAYTQAGLSVYMQ